MSQTYDKSKIFNKDYIEYWQDRVKQSAEESKVADEQLISRFISRIGILKTDKVLDLGCGFGRLFPIISQHTKNIVGLDVDYAIIDLAKKHPYLCLTKSAAEDTGFPSGFFDKIIAWATFDVFDQEKALLEQNRLLKENGLFLFTGKNARYFLDDDVAFLAERNAKLKDFPNHFTDVRKLVKKIEQFGFEVVNSFVFPKRGDLGSDIFFELDSYENDFFYEFLLILRKVTDSHYSGQTICSEFSETATSMAQENGFSDVSAFFKWHLNKFGNP